MSTLDNAIRDRAMKERRETMEKYEKLRVAAQAVVDEYDKTHLTHDVAYEDVADAIDALRPALDG